ncbi:hypothetical protein Tco_0496810 [Tanacetum coccineum]
MDLSAISITILIGLGFPSPSRLNKENDIMLMLAPRLANALLSVVMPIAQGGQNLRMKFCFNSSQFFACLGDVLSNHLLATPISVRGNTCKRVESFMLNRLATSSIFLICLIAFSVEHPEKGLIDIEKVYKMTPHHIDHLFFSYGMAHDLWILLAKWYDLDIQVMPSTTEWFSWVDVCQEVPTTDSCMDSKPLEQVQYDTGYNVFANEIQHSDQSESISNTCVVETGDRNVIPDSPDMCDNDIKNDQNDVECDDKRVALANLIANLKLDVDEDKNIQKKLKKANTTLAHELTEWKSILAETSKTLEESNLIRDSYLVALQNKQIELEKYKTFNDRTVDYEKLEHKLNETLGPLAQKDIDIKDGLKLKAYEILVVK